MSENSEYYLYIKDIKGDVQTEGLAGSFHLEDFSFDATKTDHTLQFLIPQGVSVGSFLTAINKLGTSSSMEIVTMDRTSDQPLLERTASLVLSGAGYTVVDQNSDTLSVAVTFKAFTETTKDATGKLETWGLDYTKNTELTTPLAFKETTTTAASDHATNWYLTINGMAGDVAKAGFKGAFKVDDFSLQSRVVGGGVVYEGLTVLFEPGSAEDEMLRQLMNTKGAGAAELVGTNAAGDQVMYDLRLGGAQLQSLSVDSGGGDTLTIDFDRYSLATGNHTAKGEIAGYDLLTHKAIDTQLDSAVAGKDKGLHGSDLGWKVVIDKLDSFNDDKNIAAGGFTVGNVFYEVDKGKPFGNVTLTFDAGNNQTELLASLASGTSLLHNYTIRQLADTTLGNKAISTLNLQKAAIVEYSQDASGLVTMVLDPGAMSLTTLLADGTKETVAQDNKGVVSSDAITTVVATKGDFRSIIDLDYSLVIGGMDGGGAIKLSSSDANVGRFDVDNFLVEFSRHNKIVSVSGLDLSLDLGNAETDLLNRLADGKDLTVRLIGENGLGTGVVYDLRLAAAHVTGIDHNNTDFDTLHLAIKQYSLTMNTPDGVKTFGQDLVKNIALTDPLDAAKGSSSGGTQSSHEIIDTLMAVDGIFGPGVDEDFNGTFYVYDTTVSFTGGVHPTVSDVHVHADLGSFLPKFLFEATAGKGKNISLFDLASAGDETKQVSQTDINNALISRLSFSSDGGTTLDFNPLVVGIGDPDTKHGKFFGYNNATGVVSTSTAVAANQTIGHGSQDAVDGDYYLTLSGMDGGVQDKAHEKAFVIDSFSFDISRATSSTGSGAGHQADTAKFSGMTITFDAGSSRDELLELLHDGTKLKSADISGDGLLGDDVGTILDFMLTNATVTNFHHAANIDTLTLNTDKLDITTHWFDFDKDVVESDTAGFDFVRNVAT